MPGFASANPQNVPTLRVTRVKVGSESCGIANAGRSKEQMNPDAARIVEQSCSLVSKDLNNTTYMDDLAAEESLSLYCKPVELYNIIQRRALRNPSFLQRCLSYKIQVGRQKRIKMTIRVPVILPAPGKGFCSNSKAKRSISHLKSELQGQKFFSIFVMLTTPVSSVGKGCPIYRLSQAQIMKVPKLNASLCELGGHSAVTFLLPEVRKLLLSAKKDGDCILFISSEQKTFCNGKGGQLNSLGSLSGPVLWGSLPAIAFCQSWLSHWNDGSSVTGVNNKRFDTKFQVEMHPSMLQHDVFAEGRCIKFISKGNCSNGKSLLLLQLHISAEEVGVASHCNPLNTKVFHTSHGPPSYQAQGNQTGRVVFRYFYHFNQRSKTEVTEDFSCPFCLVGGASFKGLSYHLNSTHDLFRFEFLVTPNHQLVNVICRSDLLGPEGNVQDADGFSDPRLKNFVYWSKADRWRKACSGTCQEQSLDLGKLPRNEKASLDVKLPVSREPLFLPCSEITILQEDTMCKNSVESSTVVIGSHSLGNNDVHEKAKYHLQATSSTCIPATVFSAEVSDVQMKSTSLHDQSNIHERQDIQESMSKALKEEDQLPALKNSQGSEEAFGESKVKISDGLQSSAAGEACITTIMPMQIDECTTNTLSQCTVQPSDLQVENHKLAVEHSAACSQEMLQRRQFYHSRTAQPMTLQQLFSDRDSEDDVDDEIIDIEDRRLLDDFVDVTQEEKQLMCMWNSFIRKQRVIADGHCPWACEAFAKLHASKFSENRALRRCLMLFLIKLWNHHLVDGSTINRCLSNADSCENKT